VNTFPDKKLKTFTKEVYKNWQLQMKNKKYTQNKNCYYTSEHKSYSIKQLNCIHNEICNMIDYGIMEGYCTSNFARQVGKMGTPKEIKLSNTNMQYQTISYEEYKSLLEASKNNLKYNTIFNLLFKRGPRIGEIRAFRIKDYSYEKKQLMVNHTMSRTNKLKDPKTAASKNTIDLDDEINNKIKQLIDELKKQPNFDENWFIFNGPTPISSHAIDNAKEKYFKLAGIDKHLRLHDFIHSCATWLFSMNIPITVISRILRHANINETLKTYTHLLKEDYDNGLEKINKL
jgi:integrase